MLCKGYNLKYSQVVNVHSCFLQTGEWAGVNVLGFISFVNLPYVGARTERLHPLLVPPVVIADEVKSDTATS